MRALPHLRVRAFARDTCGAAPIELALGAVMLLGIASLCFDLYSRVSAGTAGVRMAVTMADYVSRDTAPDGDELAALGEFLHAHELGVPADLVYVLTALRQPPGDPLPAIEVLWSDNSIRIGDETATGVLADTCARFVDEGGNGSLPEDFGSGLASGEVLIVAEVCARLRREGSITGKFVAGDIYCFHALPARDPNEAPAAPVYAGLQGMDRFAHRADRGQGIGSARVLLESLATLPSSKA